MALTYPGLPGPQREALRDLIGRVAEEKAASRGRAKAQEITRLQAETTLSIGAPIALVAQILGMTVSGVRSRIGSESAGTQIRPGLVASPSASTDVMLPPARRLRKPMPPAPPGLTLIPEAAMALSISRQTLYRWIEVGRIERVEVDGRGYVRLVTVPATSAPVS